MNDSNDYSIVGQAKRDWRALVHSTPEARSGKIGYAIAWLLGIPLPILLLVYLVRSC